MEIPRQRKDSGHERNVGKIGRNRGPSLSDDIRKRQEKAKREHDLWTYLTWRFKATILDGFAAEFTTEVRAKKSVSVKSVLPSKKKKKLFLVGAECCSFLAVCAAEKECQGMRLYNHPVSGPNREIRHNSGQIESHPFRFYLRCLIYH
jgi:hypothetical protein